MNIIKVIIVIFCMIVFPQISSSQEFIYDYEGNRYRTIKIGDQFWMADNLNSSLDSQGDSIESFCFYNDSNYCKAYGRLYPWTSLLISGNDSGSQGICPAGWHIPSDEEWNVLIDNFGGCNEAGRIMKSKTTPSFNIQFGGNFNTELKVFSYIDDHAYYWTSTRFSNTAAWMRQTGLHNKNINRSTVDLSYAFSIRCVKD